MTHAGDRALAQATQQRTMTAEQAVVRAIASAGTNGGRVTVAGIAAAAGVSTDFIYRHPLLRPQVESLRRKNRGPARPIDDSDHDTAASPLIRRLTQQITRERAQHQAELARLRAALEVAHGELLQLRRKITDQLNPHPE